MVEGPITDERGTRLDEVMRRERGGGEGAGAAGVARVKVVEEREKSAGEHCSARRGREDGEDKQAPTTTERDPLSAEPLSSLHRSPSHSCDRATHSATLAVPFQPHRRNGNPPRGLSTSPRLASARASRPSNSLAHQPA